MRRFRPVGKIDDPLAANYYRRLISTLRLGDGGNIVLYWETGD